MYSTNASFTLLQAGYYDTIEEKWVNNAGWVSLASCDANQLTP